MKIQIEELKGKSAYAYCRKILTSGASPDEKLEVYRGDTLSYTVNSIGEGARWVLHETSRDGFILKKYKPMSKEDKEKLK